MRTFLGRQSGKEAFSFPSFTMSISFAQCGHTDPIHEQFQQLFPLSLVLLCHFFLSHSKDAMHCLSRKLEGESHRFGQNPNYLCFLGVKFGKFRFIWIWMVSGEHYKNVMHVCVSVCASEWVSFVAKAYHITFHLELKWRSPLYTIKWYFTQADLFYNVSHKPTRSQLNKKKEMASDPLWHKMMGTHRKIKQQQTPVCADFVFLANEISSLVLQNLVRQEVLHSTLKMPAMKAVPLRQLDCKPDAVTEGRGQELWPVPQAHNHSQAKSKAVHGLGSHLSTRP